MKLVDLLFNVCNCGPHILVAIFRAFVEKEAIAQGEGVHLLQTFVEFLAYIQPCLML